MANFYSNLELFLQNTPVFLFHNQLILLQNSFFAAIECIYNLHDNLNIFRNLKNCQVITLTYQYKLKPSKQQEMEINHILDLCKSVYNYALRERKDWLSSRKLSINSCSILTEYIIPADTPYPSYNNQAKSLTKARENSS